MSGSGFLSRWSRRKLAQTLAAREAPLEPPAPRVGESDSDPVAGAAGDVGEQAGERVPEMPASPLPAPETLNLASDFTAFLREEVDEGLRRQALKKLFSDPHFNRMDGLDVYIDDYSVPSPIPPDVMERIRHAQRLLREAPGEGDAAVDADAPAPEAADALVTDADPPAVAGVPAADELANEPAEATAGRDAEGGADVADARGSPAPATALPADGKRPPRPAARES